jgi:hypothetical protein
VTLTEAIVTIVCVCLGGPAILSAAAELARAIRGQAEPKEETQSE